MKTSLPQPKLVLSLLLGTAALRALFMSSSDDSELMEFLAQLEEDYELKTIETPNRDHLPYWTPEKRAKYARRNADPTTWDLEMFREDLEGSQNRQTEYIHPAIAYLPSPVGEYDSPGGGLRRISLDIEGRSIVGYSIRWGQGDFNQHLFTNDQDLTYVYFNILVLTDITDSTKRAGHIVSRNAPHHLSSGTQLTSIGPVDWVQGALADGPNFAIVSQRYFDLDFGRTILVAPQKDGSVRFKQVRSISSPGPAFDEYLAFLEEDTSIIDFFSSEKAID